MSSLSRVWSSCTRRMGWMGVPFSTNAERSIPTSRGRVSAACGTTGVHATNELFERYTNVSD
jgi:hypothetical protein